MSVVPVKQPIDIHCKMCTYTVAEEIANAVSHGIGVIAGIIGLILMLQKGISHQLNDIQLAGITIYGLSIITLFLCSTLYHSATNPALKYKLKIADHCAIYLLIAGTYTPLMLIALSQTSATVVLIAIWSLAVIGIICKTLFIHKFKKMSLVLYLGMGWLCITVMHDLITHMSQLGFYLLLIGGLFYSAGVIFYVVKKIPYNHAIWHLFVLAGAVSHFLCIYLTVI